MGFDMWVCPWNCNHNQDDKYTLSPTSQSFTSLCQSLFPFSLYPHTPLPRKQWSSFCHYILFPFSRIYNKLDHTVCILVCLTPVSMIILTFLHVIAHTDSYFFLRRIPLYEYTTMCLFIHLLMGIWVISSLGLLHIQLQRMFMCKSLCGKVLWVLCG